MTTAAADFPRGVTITNTPGASNAASVILPLPVAGTSAQWIVTDIEAELIGAGPNTAPQTLSAGPTAGPAFPTVNLAATPGFTWKILGIDALIAGTVAFATLITVTGGNGPTGILANPGGSATTKDEWTWEGVITGAASAAMSVTSDGGQAGTYQSINVKAILISNTGAGATTHNVSTSITGGPTGILSLPASPTGFEETKDTWSWTGQLPANPDTTVTVFFDGNNPGNLETLTVKAYAI